jgi:gluconate 2-dehydrogenase gamma chain
MSGDRDGLLILTLPGQTKNSMLIGKTRYPGLVPEAGETAMKKQGFDRRDFLKTAVVSGAAAAGGTAAVVAPEIAQAQQPAPAAPGTAELAGYAFLNLDEAAFVEALVDHMVPADEISPKGTDLGVNIYIDRALGGAWGKGERLYMQGPWKLGSPSQGYQLPLTPAQLYRAGIAATNAHCRKAYGKTFDRIDATQRQEVLIGLSTGKITFDSGLPVRVFWATLYQTVVEGMYSDPIYGRMGDHRLSRNHRGAPRSCGAVSRQAVPDQARRHRGHELKGAP